MGAVHARTVAASPLIDVVAVADTDAAAAAAVAGDIGASPSTTTDHLRDVDGIDAWLIATPTTTHPALVRMALASGLHVLCEKPLALDPADSERLGAEAESADRVLQIGFWRRFSPPWATAKRLIEKGAIGRPLMIRLSQWDADPPPAEFCDPASSGGLAIDCGVHEVDLAEWLSGRTVQRVTSFNLPLVDQSLATVGDVDNLVAVLEMGDGVVATVDLSRNCRYEDDVRTEILGEQGAIFVDLLPIGRTRLATASGVQIVAGSETEDAFGVGILRQAEAFARAVAGENVDIPGASASTRAVATGLAIQQAANGEPVEL
jgi:myo-inositol 2-dehydrogenase/D-chiro-inositol 1-dehydrogenase